MISLLFFAIIASASAAPQSLGDLLGPPGSPFYPGYAIRREPYLDDVFDTNRYWADISKELREIDDMLADFSRRFQTSRSEEGIQGNEYKITIPLSGFDEKDVVVKAKEGLLMIQATHYAGIQRNYLDIRTLPSSVDVNGTWIFENSILTIVFPLKEGVQTEGTVTVVSTEFTTRSPILDREEVEKDSVEKDESGNADVGVNRATDTDIMTNEIPDRNEVEATTYAVDLNDEVEFVPVRY